MKRDKRCNKTNNVYYDIANKNKISTKERIVIILQRLKAELMDVLFTHCTTV